MLDSMTQADLSSLYEVRAESEHGRVQAFGARRTRSEAEVLLAESIRRVEAAHGHNNLSWAR
jgi:hypothetical protein